MICDRLKFIEYGSPEYLQAARLRYRLFYEEHGIEFESIFETSEKQSLHLVITSNIDLVLAYGRLDRKSVDQFQIYQMVVEPTYQRQGLGTAILKTLIAAATERGASIVLLNARVAMQFYEVFASSSTGVPHIRMQKRIF